MARYALLNNVEHRDLRVIPRHGAQFGDNVATVQAFPNEFGSLQREYPLFFRKDRSTGEFESLALLGLQRGENLFLEGERWNAGYVPATVARGPFLIGYQERRSDGEIRKEAVIHVDLEDPRVSRTEGIAAFLPDGGNTPYIEHISTLLRGIQDGAELSRAMFAEFVQLDLITPVKLEVTVSETEKYALDGLHTINNEKLAALDVEALQRLHRNGFLQAAFLVMNSIGNVNRLMTIKQRRNARGAEAVAATA
jgi:hypothetical protein